MPTPTIDSRDEPTDISIIWRKRYTSHPFEDHDDYAYRVEWADGRSEEYASIPERWHGIYIASINRRQDAAFRKLDATLESIRTDARAA